MDDIVSNPNFGSIPGLSPEERAEYGLEDLESGQGDGDGDVGDTPSTIVGTEQDDLAYDARETAPADMDSRSLDSATVVPESSTPCPSMEGTI